MPGALEGFRVLDLTQYEAGTSGTQILAMLGADVVKVEPPGVGDPGRGFGATMANTKVDSLYFLSLNCNKRSISLNLKSDEGKTIFFDLLQRFDAVVENFAMGTMESFGLTYEVLREKKPSLIYATLKGFGTWGPYANYRSFDMIAQATGGIMSTTGLPTSLPMRVGASLGDTGAGMKLAMGVLAAYCQLLKTGTGQKVEVAMQESVASDMRVVYSGRKIAGDPLRRGGNNLTGLAPTDTYACKPFGSNDYVYLVVITAQMIENLFIAIGHPEAVDDPRLKTTASRIEANDWMHSLISPWMAERTKWEAMHELQSFGVPCGAVYDSGDIFKDEHLRARGFIQEMEHPIWGTLQFLDSPLRLSESPTELRLAPDLGQDNEAVLCGELGIPRERLQSLRSDRII